MEKEQALETESLYPLVDEPHFDEEWTILTARPVVPLKDLNSNGGRHTALKLVAAFGVAMMLGALVALISVRLTQTNDETSADSISPSNAQVSESSTENPSIPESAALVSSANGAPAPILAQKAPVKVTDRPKNPLRRSEKSEPQSNRQPVEGGEVELSDLRAELFDQWQEQRARQVTARQVRRERRLRHRRDLRRIDEIFEGMQPE